MYNLNIERNNEKYFVLGVIIFFYAIYLATIEKAFWWYSPAMIGATIFLSSINSGKSEKSFLGLLRKNPRRLIYQYIMYVMVTIISEIIFKNILHLWYYPHFDTVIQHIVNVYLIGYPFALFFLYELYTLFKSREISTNKDIVLTTIIGGYVSEIPNTYVHEWVYVIPYVNLTILNINVVVTIGWVLLVFAVLIVEKIIWKK